MIEKLIELIKENPDLPILPMVDAEVVEEDYGRWMGTWGNSRVDEYIITKEDVVFKSDDDVFDVLEKYLPYKEFEKLPEDEDGCRKFYNNLPWMKAIIVDINLP